MGERLQAHDPGFSTAVLTVGENSIEGMVRFSREELDSLISRSHREEADLLLSSVLLVGDKAPTKSEAYVGTDNDFLLRFSFPKPHAKRISIRSPIVSELHPGHRQYLMIRDGDHDLVMQKLLKSNAHTVVLELPGRVDSMVPDRGNASFKVEALILSCSLAGFLTFAMILFWRTGRFALFSAD